MYSNICTYLQIFAPRFKHWHLGGNHLYMCKWFVPRCKWIIPRHSCRVQLAKQETLTPPGHLVSPLVCRGSCTWMSTVVLYCKCHSDSASVLLYFTQGTNIYAWVSIFITRYKWILPRCKRILPIGLNHLHLCANELYLRAHTKHPQMIGTS